MHAFLTYLEAHKTQRFIVGIISLPEEPHPQPDKWHHYELAKRRFLEWFIKQDEKRLNHRLPGTPHLEVAGSHAFWQKLLRCKAAGEPALSTIVGIAPKP